MKTHKLLPYSTPILPSMCIWTMLFDEEMGSLANVQVRLSQLPGFWSYQEDLIISRSKTVRSGPLRARLKAPAERFRTRTYTCCHVASLRLSLLHIPLLSLSYSPSHHSLIPLPIRVPQGSSCSHNASLWRLWHSADCRRGKAAVIGVWVIENWRYLENGKSNRLCSTCIWKPLSRRK